MRVSLSKIALIDKFIFDRDRMCPSERMLLESYRILESEFDLEIENQKKSIGLVMKSARKKLKEEIEGIHNELFHPNSKNAFQTEIFQLFQK